MMTNESKLFIKELTELLDKHNVSMEAVDDDSDYYPSVNGIECCMHTMYDDDFNIIRNYQTFRLPVEIDSKLTDKDINNVA